MGTPLENLRFPQEHVSKMTEAQNKWGRFQEWVDEEDRK